jgi:Ca-activated chloride channel family protein
MHLLTACPRVVTWVATTICAVAAGLQSPIFRATAELVPIYATVRAEDGRLLTDLDRDDFEVWDDERRQTIVTFSKEPVPITIVALWDVSPSIASSMDRLRAAARLFVDATWRDDRMRFGTFGDEIAFSPLVTNDKRVLRRIVDEELWPGNARSPVWSAISRGLSLVARESGRRVLVVLSDGEAAGDRATRGDVEVHLQKLDCMVYVLGLDSHHLSRDIRGLADITGGGFRILRGENQFAASLADVVTELHHQYLLGFVPEVLDGAAHALRLQVKVPGAKVRARKGYFASRRF